MIEGVIRAIPAAGVEPTGVTIGTIITDTGIGTTITTLSPITITTIITNSRIFCIMVGEEMNETPTHVAGVSSNKSMLNLTQYELALD